jgi:hypothetical protein
VAVDVVFAALLPGHAAVRGLGAATVVAAVYASVMWRAAPEWLRLAAVQELSALSGRFER